MADLRRVVASIAAASAAVGAPVVTGDTKVVDRGKGDGIYINTSAVGRVRDGVDVGSRARASPGDVMLVSGPVGDHGIAVMAARNGIAFETALRSDSASVLPLVRALLDVAPETRVAARSDARRAGHGAVRDRRRVAGGDAASTRRRCRSGRRCRAPASCSDFDPLYVACEGRFLAIVPAPSWQAGAGGAARPPRRRARAVASARSSNGSSRGRVLLRTRIGSHRRLERLSGEQLPRIC